LAEKGSRILGRVLPAAVRLWLRSQVDQIEQLDLQLQGTDRQVLGGRIPGISLSAQDAIYKGIYLDRVIVSATGICINLGQVVRGKPLRLLQAFPVAGEVRLSQDSLNASLSGPFLAEGVESFWHTLLSRPAVAAEIERHYGVSALEPTQTVAQLADNQITLTAGARQLQTGLTLAEGRWLCLEHPSWLIETGPAPSQALQGFRWDLGQETQIQTLSLQPGQLVCAGQVDVKP